MEKSNVEKQLLTRLWGIVNDRYPGSMITKADFVPLAKLKKPLSKSRLSFVSTSGVQLRGTMPLDKAHPIGDYTFRRVSSN
jgi:D-proline reductase (dithiol) PrdB